MEISMKLRSGHPRTADSLSFGIHLRKKSGGFVNKRREFPFFALLCVLLTSACNPVSYDLKKFLEEQTGTITVKEAVPKAGQVALGTDGYVCLVAGWEAFSIALDNPIGYNLTVESSFTPTLGTEISGVTVSQTDTNFLTVNIPSGSAAGNEGILHIKVKTAKEGRTLYEGDMDLAFIDFDTRLTTISFPDDPGMTPSFAPDNSIYSIADAPASFAVRAEASNSAARVTIDGEAGTGFMNRQIVPPVGKSTVLIRVEVPHGAGPPGDYTIEVVRTFLGIAISSEPAKKVYALQSSPNTGIETNGLIVVDNTQAIPLDSAQYALTYDFTSPGAKTVALSYKGAVAGFTVWVVGLSGLEVTGPGGYTAVLDFDPSSTAGYSKDLGTIPCTVDRLDITALSGVADAEGSTLTMTRKASGASDLIRSPANSRESIDLVTNASPPLNTITITVSINRDGTLNDASRTYTLELRRASLTSGTELFVSPTGNDSDGNGSADFPYATVGKALTIIKDSMLGSTPGDPYLTITISGTITGNGSPASPMADITAGGYPHIFFRGKGSGMEAGILDANGTGRVLYIGGGNKVTMEENLTLAKGSVSTGGGVYIGSGSTFTMNGGTIRGSIAGGGVYIVNGSTFTMNRGTIEGNTAGSGGGVCAGSGSTFTMNGGTIEGNTSTSTDRNTGGGGVYISGGSTFIMNDGTIEGNTGGGGVALTGSGTSFAMKGGTIRGNASRGNGGGVDQNDASTFTMEGGTIRGNTASLEGGGVSTSISAYNAQGSTFTMQGNAVIEWNSARSGGGVCVNGSTFTLQGNAVIRNNTGTYTGNTYSGGGVVANNSTFTMSGNAVIRDNTTLSTAGGGGVYVAANGSVFTMYGGTIQGNTAVNGSGGGVYVHNYLDATFAKTGGTIYGNDDTAHTEDSTENTAASGKGHAVYVNSSPEKKRNSNAGASLNLYAKHNGSLWTFIDDTEGGAGDTTENWEE
jgi:hypothetical protein